MPSTITVQNSDSHKYNTFRNRFFIKFPGRDLHGVTGFLQGFTTAAWLTGLLALLTVPLFLTTSSKILNYFSLPDQRSFPYPWTVFTYLNAFAQKVQPFSKQTKI